MKKYYFIWGIALALSCLSCNDWLDVRPETEQKEEDQFSTYKGFRDALIGCYMAMGGTDVYGEKLTMSHIESLANLWQTFSSSTGDRLADYYLSLHDYQSDEARSAMQAIWSGLYNVIVQANMIIKYADENKEVFESEAARAVIQGEAYAIRAYCQLDVLRLFGQLPQNATIQVSLPYTYTTAFNERPEYYDFANYVLRLKEDLNKAEELLKDNDPVFSYTFEELGGPAYGVLEDEFFYYRQTRLNYWAVKALKARMYLYLGEKENAYNEAMALINAVDVNGNKLLELSGNSDIVENGYKACPSECFFRLSKYNIKTVASFLIGGNTDATYSDLYISAEQLNDLFEGQSTDSHNRYRYVWNRSVRDYYDDPCAAILKYYFSDEVENAAVNYQIIPMLRMSEIYLIAIETTPSLAEANQLYADYMFDRNVVLSGDAFTSLYDIPQVIEAEYRREFFAEGQMFYTYKRMNTKTVLWNYEEMTEEDYVLWECVSSEFNA